jgi:YfiH family protein
MDILSSGIITSSLLAGYDGLVHGISTRPLGNISFDRCQTGLAPENFQNFLRALGINPEISTVGILPAKHTSVIACVVKKAETGRIILKPDREKEDGEIQGWGCGDLSFMEELPGYNQGTDAAVSNSPNLYLSLLHADCAPIMLYDPKTKFFGLAHAGIIGALTDILPATVRYLRNFRVNPKNLKAYIGPCICSKCYKAEESRHYEQLEKRFGDLLRNFDLRNYLYRQLFTSGLRQANIEISSFCTACSPELFFSNHLSGSDQTEGRQMSIIGLKSW